MKTDNKPIHEAATVILLRDKPHFEVLLLRRSAALRFGAGSWVFPGGKVDPSDYDKDVFNDASIHPPLGQEHLNAAVREAKEECGVEISHQTLLPYSHWTTPNNFPKRFATWILLNTESVEANVTIDHSEIDAYQWLSPKEALLMANKGALKLMPPTYVSLLEMSQFNAINELAQFSQQRSLPVFNPRPIKTENNTTMLYEGDSGYEQEDLSATKLQHRLLIGKDRFDYINTL